MKIQIILVVILGLSMLMLTVPETYMSLVDVDKIPGSDYLLLADETGQQLHFYSKNNRTIEKSVELGDEPTGATISKDGKTIYATIGKGASSFLIIKAKNGRILKNTKVGHGLNSPVLSLDGKKVYACNRFCNSVVVMDAKNGKILNEIPVAREPISADVTPDGKYLYVANHLPEGRADLDYVASKLTIIDLENEKKIKDVKLVNGAEGMRDVKVSKDGRYVYATHLMARYQIPTSQIERGWINTNALSVVSTATQKLLYTVLLDDLNMGFANPCAIEFSNDGNRLMVTSAGNNELMFLEMDALHQKIAKKKNQSEKGEIHLDMHNDLTFITEIRDRIQLNCKGPRAMNCDGELLYVAGYFSESMDIVNVETKQLESVQLKEPTGLTQARQGEIFFNDASLCFQKWQSCASCHSYDGRMDGRNWDLLNDGIGNPKNAKSLLHSHVTAPVMALGVRADAEAAVRAGIKYIQFAVRPNEDAQAVDAYLENLKPLPSPHLVNGKLSESAHRGAKVYEKAGCAFCHSGDYYTDYKSYDLGTGLRQDAGKAFDTPTLIEVWRTAPYMHDGRAATLEEAIDWHYKNNHHQLNITENEKNDLIEYVKSL